VDPSPEEPIVHSFRLLDRDWILQVNRYTRRDVLAATENKVDLFSAFDGKLMLQLADPETMTDVVWAMLADQRKDITDEQFIRAVTGPIADKMEKALRGAIIDFFRERQRRMLTAALAKADEAVDAAVSQALDKIQNLSADQLLNSGSTNSPASSASTPAT
jgi:hypothetical protein